MNVLNKSIDSNKNESEKIFFNLPVSLVNGVLVQKFHTASKNQEYIVTIGDRQYHVNSSIANLINLIDGESSLDKIANNFSLIEKKSYNVNDIIQILNHFFIQNRLIKSSFDQPSQKPTRTYLRFRSTLLPKKIIHPITGILQVLFHPFVMFPLIVICFIFHFYFFSTLNAESFRLLFNSPRIFVVVAGLSLISTIMHELGHASACRSYGAKHGYIGVGIYLYFPVFFTDVTDVWRLSRIKRTVVDFGGLYFQFLFNLILYGAYLLTGYAGYLYPIVFIGIQTISTLNPFFRFDGYWIASDIIGVPNLRKHSKETLQYFWNKLFGKNYSKQPYLLTLKRSSKIALILYAGLSNLFFIFIFYRISLFLPSLIKTYPAFLVDSIKSLGSNFEILDWKQIGLTIYQVTLRSIPILFITFFLLRIIKMITKKVSILIHHISDKRSNENNNTNFN